MSMNRSDTRTLREMKTCIRRYPPYSCAVSAFVGLFSLGSCRERNFTVGDKSSKGVSAVFKRPFQLTKLFLGSGRSFSDVHHGTRSIIAMTDIPHVSRN